jgi:hypothetical protein
VLEACSGRRGSRFEAIGRARAAGWAFPGRLTLARSGLGGYARSVVCLRAEDSRVETRIAQVQARIAEHQQELGRLHQHRRAIARRLAIVRHAGVRTGEHP